MSDLRVGYIGLGLMGKPMATNLLKAGFPLVVHNRSRSSVDELVARGATAATTPADVAARVDVVCLNLPDSPDVRHVVLGPGGVAEKLKPGGIVIDNSTIKPSVAQEIAAALAERGISFLDAPVSGGQIGAVNGTLSVMVGGDGEAVERAMPIFRAVGKTVNHIGGPGAGQVCKAANQIMVASQMVAMGELLVFSKQCGADPDKVVRAVKGGAAQCWALDNKPQRILAGNREPGFKASMQSKDLGIVMDTAREFGAPLPATAVNHQLYLTMLQHGMDNQDHSAVVGVMELMANTHVGPDPAPES